MRRFGILLALAVLSLGGATVASATTCNIDFKASISQTAYDFGIILPTVESITGLYNGSPGADDVFSGINISYPGTTTYLHWHSPATPIVNGTRIHVGWTTASGECPHCVTGFFTDINGNKIPGTDVSLVAVNHDGRAVNDCKIPIKISHIRGACLAAPLNLADLNRTNGELVAQLRYLSDGATLDPGASFPFPLPFSAASAAKSQCGAIVYNYDIEDQPSALISPWVQIP